MCIKQNEKMKRTLYASLLSWKNASNRKPLILQGARQVGKTWLMKEFGKKEFEQVVYLNFESSERLRTLFTTDFDIKRIITIIYILKFKGKKHKVQSDVETRHISNRR